MLTLHGRVLTDGEEIPPTRIEIEADQVVGFDVGGGAAGADFATDGWIAHGLVDLQVNGAVGVDFTSATDPESAVEVVARELVKHGVTSFCPTIVSSAPEVILERLPALRRRDIPGGARSLGAHVEGPFISPKYPGVHDPHVIRPPSLAEIDRWIELSPPAIVTLAPEIPGAIEAIRRLRGAGVAISLGHSGADAGETLAAIHAGATAGTHLFNAMAPVHHRAPGIVAGLLASDATIGLLADGVHVDRLAVQLAIRAAGPSRIALVSDCIAAAGARPGPVKLGEQTVVSDGVAVRRADGTLSGSAAFLDAGLRNARAWCSWLPRARVIEMATSTPAGVLGIRPGPGNPVDMVVLDRDWNVEMTIVGGEVVYRAT